MTPEAYNLTADNEYTKWLPIKTKYLFHFALILDKHTGTKH